MKRADSAVNFLLNGDMCSEGVLKSYAQDFGIDLQTASKISAGFAGGMAQGKTCGAVAGAFMVIGLKYYKGDNYSRDLCFANVQEFSGRFIAKRGSIECFDILRSNGINPENKVEISNLRDKKLCDKIVRDAVEILELVINEEL